MPVGHDDPTLASGSLPPTEEIAAPQVLVGAPPRHERFELGKCLGAGGMGVVYEAFDRARGERVALKTLLAFCPEALLAFKGEFRALRDLRHPSLVALHELFEHRGSWFFTMDLVEGGNFMSNARADGALDESRTRSLLLDLARGLVALHAAGKVHRDIKPSNVLVGRDGSVKIVDFGLIADASADRSREPGRVVGTIPFMAPEQALGKAVSPAADWYGVGVMLFMALTGELPFGGDRDALLERKVLEDAPRAKERTPGVPSDLDDLCARLLARDPCARPLGAHVLAELGGAPSLRRRLTESAPFVGREHEIAELERALGEARNHAPAPIVVVLEGESGAGKTSLVNAFVRGLTRDAWVLAGRCHEREAVPYKGVDGVIDALARALDEMSDEDLAPLVSARSARLAGAFPVLARVSALARELGGDVPPSAAQYEQRRDLFGALREILARCAARAPLVVTIDDFQWADADSTALLDAVLSGEGAPGLLLVLNLRIVDGGVRVPLAWRPRSVHVGPLGAAEARALAQALIDRVGAPELRSGEKGEAGEASAIAREAGGHPLFIHELVSARALGKAPRARLDEAITARVASLGERDRRLLELLSIAPAPVPIAIAAAALGASDGAVLAIADELRHARLARSAASRFDGRIEPYHARVRDAVGAALADDAKRALHRTMAETLEAHARAAHEDLAVHWREAGDAKACAPHALRAAETAKSALAFDRASRFLRMALEGEVDRVAVTADLGDALANAGRGTEAAAAYLAAARDAGKDTRDDLLRKAAEQQLRAGRIDEGRATLRELLATLGERTPTTAAGALASLVVGRARLFVRGSRLRERDASGAPSALALRVDALYAAVTGLALVDPINAGAFQARHLAHALDLGDPRRAARAFALEASLRASEGSGVNAASDRALEQADALAARLRDPYLDATLGLIRGVIAFNAGRWPEARGALDGSLRMLRSAGTPSPFEVSVATFFGLSATFFLGEIEALGDRVRAETARAEECGDLYLATMLTTGRLNVVALLRDDVEGARANARERLARWSQRGFHVQHYDNLSALAETDLYAGEGAAAHARVMDAWPRLSRSMLLRAEILRHEAYALRGRAALGAASALPAGRRRAYLREALRCARVLERDDLAWSRPTAGVLRAGAAALRGDRARAAATLGRAADGYAVASMPLFAAVARRWRGALEGDAEAVRAADAWLAVRGARRPERIAAALLPGFEG